MEMKFILLAVVALVGIVCEVNGEACCTPDQWQGVQASVSGFVYRHKPGRVEGVVYVFYDYANKQSAAFANYTSSSAKPRSYRIVTRYSNKTCASCSSGKLYVVDLKTDKCYTKKLDRPFRKACIPDSAKDTGSFSLGAGDASLKTRGYNLELRSQKYQLDFKLSVTEEGCIPVSELVTGVARGVPFMETVGFVNIKPGIKDPAVFDVPEECEETVPGFIQQALDREYSVFSF
ncbi:ependymin-related protein 1-like [Littorina saxatilis]|uniref:Uncharacterized protein n=1 Tax=Littorina saxatilis TaxID=31220 RepID=A0AAN9AZC0_9CAEN